MQGQQWLEQGPPAATNTLLTGSPPTFCALGTEASLTGKEASRAYAAKRLRTKVVLPSPVSPTSRIFRYLRQVAGGEVRKKMNQQRVAVPCPPAGSFMYLRQAKTTSGVERRGENMNKQAEK